MSESPYVPLAELAEFLSVHPQTVRRWLETGVIPQDCYIEIGTFRRFNLKKVEQHLLGVKVDDVDSESNDEVEYTEERRPVQLVLDFGDNDDGE